MKNYIVAMVALLGVGACGDSDGSDAGAAGGGAESAGGGAGTAGGGTGAISVDVEPDHFIAEGLADGSTITTEACTLSGGTQTTCYRITVKSRPQEHSVGPFCPRNISDDATQGGIWPEDGVVHDIDGAFIANLATFYGDDNWKLYDEATGGVNVTDTLESCQGAARPNVDPRYQNHCVECSTDYLEEGATITYLIPVTPVPLASPSEIGMNPIGVAFNGVKFDAPAPVNAILANYTIAAFDDCGGHINLATGYHYHAATGCSKEVAQEDGHAPLLGYALDGYGLYALLDDAGEEPTDLDDCRGHSDDVRGYHYHVAGAGENTFIGCFHGEHGSQVR